MRPVDPNDPLERLFDRTLRDLPLRRAPPTLEPRVYGELQRRAARPWWRRSFAHWPPAARAALLAVCGALGALTVLGAAAVAAGFHSLSWVRQAGMLAASLGQLGALIAQSSPPAWLYEGIAACAVLYAVLFGLGAVAYRTLYLKPTSSGSIA